MLKIWGRMSSINVRKVVWCAQELGVDFERIDAGGTFGLVHEPEYLKRNPNALVPVLEDDSPEPAAISGKPMLLWESNVIVRYLCAKHSLGGMYPEQLVERFDAERWMDWQQTTLNRVSAGAFIQWVRTQASERNAELIAQSVQRTEPLFAMLNAHLEGQAFMCGDTFSMADIPVGCEAHRWFGLPAAEYCRPRWPNVERWFAALRSRPGAQGVLDRELE